MKRFISLVLIALLFILPVNANDVSGTNAQNLEQEPAQGKTKSEKIQDVILFPLVLVNGVFCSIDNIINGNFYKPWISREEKEREAAYKAQQQYEQKYEQQRKAELEEIIRKADEKAAKAQSVSTPKLAVSYSEKAQNFLQQEYEETLKEEKADVDLLFDTDFLLKNDYQTYLKGGHSIYGVVLDKITMAENSRLPSKYVELDYLTQIKRNIENVVKNQAGMLPIIIPDNRFKILGDDIKDLVAFNNIFAQVDKSIYLYSAVQGFNAQIRKWQEAFDKNKNNPKALKDLYYEVKSKKEVMDTYLKAKNKTQDRVHNKLNECYTALDSISYAIYQQGENYEKQKFLAWAQKNNKKLIGGRLSNYVYYAQAPAPRTGYLYEHVAAGDFYLRVLQSVPGGVILTGDYLGPYGPSRNGTIFLQTSKQFADGQIVRENIVAEYKGFYDYTTVLGARKRIYKFYRLGQKEINANFDIPGQPFYFYMPY